jgi:hypothetical protein
MGNEDMAKPSDLVQAATRVASEKTVKETYRQARQAGYIQTGMAGRYGGAEMTERDATNLLLALTCAMQVKEAGNAVQLYRSLFGEVIQHKMAGRGTDTEPYMSLCPEPVRWLSNTAQGLTLGMAIDRLIGMAREGELQALFRDLVIKQGVQDHEAWIDRAINLPNMVSLKLEFRRPRPGATIAFGRYLTVDFNYRREMPDRQQALDSLEGDDCIDTKTISHRTIFALGEALRG